MRPNFECVNSASFFIAPTSRCVSGENLDRMTLCLKLSLQLAKAIFAACACDDARALAGK